AAAVRALGVSAPIHAAPGTRSRARGWRRSVTTRNRQRAGGACVRQPLAAIYFRLPRRACLGLPLRHPGGTPNAFDQLMRRSATGVVKLVDFVFASEPAQAQQLAEALAPVQLQLGRPIREQESPHFSRAEELSEFGRCLVD